MPARAQIAGLVHNDVNGLTNGTVDGPGTRAEGLNAVLVDLGTGLVTDVVAVMSSGAFTFSNPDSLNYQVLITADTATVGATPPPATLSPGWVFTGEYRGTGSGDDGSPDGKLALGWTDAETALHFGIEESPVTNRFMAPFRPFPGTGVAVNLLPAYFGGLDYSGGQIDSLRIRPFPDNVTTLTVDGTPYTVANFPAAGLYVPTNAAGSPTVPISVVPATNTDTVTLYYAAIDNAAVIDPEGGLVQILFGFTVTEGHSAQELVDLLTGEGVIVLNPVLNGTCPATARGAFNYNNDGNPLIDIDSGIILTSGRALTVDPLTPGQTGVNAAYENFASNAFNGPGDADLTAISGSSTNDACVLEFDFVPAGDSIKFDYVFASEEYNCPTCSSSGSGTGSGWNFNCSFNDVFGFFISGPGFTGLNNIAVIPGSGGVAVGVSTVNDGAGNCSNYTQYYNANAGGGELVYSGFTDVFTAVAGVTPCDTYHLKLAIADAVDGSYDSGVFLKAGSLNSSALVVKTFGGAGLETPNTNTVRGCPPGVVRISRTGALHQPVTVNLEYDGDAVMGQDYQALPASVVMAAGDSVINLSVVGIPNSNPQGPKSCVVKIMSPYTCDGLPLVLSSDTIMIYDSIYVDIELADTAICIGESVELVVEADSLLEFTWTPSAGVDDPSAQQVVVSPTDSTTYTVSVSLPMATGCPPATDQVVVDVKVQPVIDLGPDRFSCGDPVELYAGTQPFNDDESFLWTPSLGLSNDTIRDPVAFLTGDIEYVVTVNPGAVGCDGQDTIKLTLLPDHIELLNNDTVVCAGALLDISARGHERFSYNWTPELYVTDPLGNPTTLEARESGYYTLTASFPGCVDMPDSFYLEVQPVPAVNIGADRVICTYDTIQLHASVDPPGYPDYTYAWEPEEDLTDPGHQDPVFDGDESVRLRVTVTTPLGCEGSDEMEIVVNPGDFLSLNLPDTGACPPAEFQLRAEGAAAYTWSPERYLDDPASGTPLARPETPTLYQVIGRSEKGCLDTQTVFLDVYPAAVVYLPDTVQVWPGESYRMSPGGKASYYTWFPSSGLDNPGIANPEASPEVRTRYFVTAATEKGCTLLDSIDVLVHTESVLDVPNAFTPGGGPNGLFRIVKRGQATLHSFRVYNRWGNVVFETSDIDEGWDGMSKGAPQPMGVYVYIIEAVSTTGKRFVLEGDVTLVR